MRWGRWLGLFVLTAVTIALLVYGFIEPPVWVELARADYGTVQELVTEEGKTRLVDRFLISAPVAGFARRIELDVGDFIEANAPLVELEPLRALLPDPRARAEAQARIAAAEARLRVAAEEVRAREAQADQAHSALARLQRLGERGEATAQEIDVAESQDRLAQARRSSARFAVDVARFELEAAKTALQFLAAEVTPEAQGRVQITAPVAGRVLAVYHESEGVVAAGDPLLELGDPQTLEVEVEVLSEDAVRIRPEMRVTLERWGGEQPLEGRVRVVEPTGFTKISALGVEEQRVRIISDLISPAPEWERLGHGFRVEASFLVAETADVLRIPASAVHRHAGGWAVFVVEDDRAQRRRVEIGARNGRVAAITTGITKGELVIVHPNDRIADGTRVESR